MIIAADFVGCAAIALILGLEATRLTRGRRACEGVDGAPFRPPKRRTFLFCRLVPKLSDHRSD